MATTVAELIAMLSRMPQDMPCVLFWTEYDGVEDSVGYNQWRDIESVKQYNRSVHLELGHLDTATEKLCEEDHTEFYLQGSHLQGQTPTVTISEIRNKERPTVTISEIRNKERPTVAISEIRNKQ